MVTGPDRIAIINADGSFREPLVEDFLRGLILELLGPLQAPPALSSYAQVSALEDYPDSFPPTVHGHTLGQVNGITNAGQVLLTAETETERQSALGLDLVDNVADLDKPISLAVQTVLNTLITTTAARALVTNRTPTLYANSATTVPARATVVNEGYTGPVIVDISDYPRSSALDAAALAVMLNGDRLIRRRA